MHATPPPARRSTRELRSAIFRDAAGIVAVEFARPLTVDELARRVASSPRQVRRAFSEAGGMTFRAFLTSVRMKHAAALLETTDAPVHEVGRQVGYREPSQFTKAFKRAYGLTPSAFRTAQSASRDSR